MADKNIDQSEKQIEKLTKHSIQSITKEDWQKEISHVERLEKEYWKCDRLIISLGGEETSESESENEQSDESDSMTGIEPIVYMMSTSVRIDALTKENYETWKLQIEALLVKNDG